LRSGIFQPVGNAAFRFTIFPAVRSGIVGTSKAILPRQPLRNMKTSKKITVKFLKGAGIYYFFAGSKNMGSSNTPNLNEAVEIAKQRFPKSTLVLKDFYKSA
jgi:hypothetical protein